MSAAPLKRLEIEGPLVVTETDGGFLPDQIEIGGVDITTLIAELCGLRVSERGWSFESDDNARGVFDLGMVRLTMEQLSDTPALDAFCATAAGKTQPAAYYLAAQEPAP